MRRYLPALLVSLACVLPVLGCDLLKSKDVDAGADGASVAVATADAAVAAVDTATPAVTTAAPLTPGAPAVAPNGRPAVKLPDGGTVVVADGGARSDAAASPTPLPQFPGFDAGAFKGFDAGGLFKGFDAGGFNPFPR